MHAECAALPPPPTATQPVVAALAGACVCLSAIGLFAWGVSGAVDAWASDGAGLLNASVAVANATRPHACNESRVVEDMRIWLIVCFFAPLFCLCAMAVPLCLLTRAVADECDLGRLLELLRR